MASIQIYTENNKKYLKDILDKKSSEIKLNK